MSKSILVVDTPEYCAECPCSDDCTEVCRPLDRLITEVNGECEKPDWCPLRDIPGRKPEPRHTSETAYTLGIYKGWNNCIDEVLREAEPK